MGFWATPKRSVADYLMSEIPPEVFPLPIQMRDVEAALVDLHIIRQKLHISSGGYTIFICFITAFGHFFIIRYITYEYIKNNDSVAYTTLPTSAYFLFHFVNLNL